MFKLPAPAQRAAEDSIDSLYGSLSNISIVVNSLLGNELSYTLIHNINQYVTKNPYNSISLYHLFKEPLPTSILTTVFSMAELPYDRGPIITTDPHNWVMTTSQTQAKVFLYIYNPLLYQYIDAGIRERIAQSKNTVLFTRNKEHKMFMEQIGFKNICDYFVPDCELELMEEMIRKYT